MLIEIYSMLWITGIAFSAISWMYFDVLNSKNILFAFFGSFMILATAIGAADVEYQHCQTPTNYINNSDSNISEYYYSTGQEQGSERYESPFNCTTFSVEQTPMIIFNGLLGVFQFAYAVIMLLDGTLNAQAIGGAGREEQRKQEVN